jgi:hypothetical protein
VLQNLVGGSKKMAFLKSVFNDLDKSMNPAHIIALLLTAAVVVWGCWEAWHTHAMPSNLGGAAQLLGGAGAVNVAHKAEDIIAKFKGTSVPDPAASVQS